MKLYYSTGTCSLAIRIILHELNITCEYIAVNLKTKLTEKGVDFFSINSKGSVPVLQLDNGEVLTENSVIQVYLADTYKATSLLPPLGDFNRYRVLEWLNFDSTDIHKGFSPLFNTNVPQDVKDTVFKPLLRKRLDFLDAHFTNHTFFVGDVFTLPDAYLFVMLRWLKPVGLNLDDWQNLKRFYTDTKLRPAVETALAEEN